MPTSRYFKPREETYLPMATRMWYANQRQQTLDYETGQSGLDTLNTGLSQVRAYSEDDKANLQRRKDYYSDRINQAITSTKGKPTNMLSHIRQINRDFQQDIGSGELYGINRTYDMAQEDTKRMQGRIADNTLNQSLIPLQQSLIGTGRQVPNAPDFNKDIQAIVKMGEEEGKTPLEMAGYASNYLQNNYADYFDILDQYDESGKSGESELLRMNSSIANLTALGFDTGDTDPAMKMSSMLKAKDYEKAFDEGFDLIPNQGQIDPTIRGTDYEDEFKFLEGDFTEEGQYIPRRERTDVRTIPGHQIVSGDMATWVPESEQKTIVAGTEDYISKVSELRKSFKIGKEISDQEIAEDWNAFRRVEGYAPKLFQPKSRRPDLYKIDLREQLYVEGKGYGNLAGEQMWLGGEELRGADKKKVLADKLGYDITDKDEHIAFKKSLEGHAPSVSVSGNTGGVAYVYTLMNEDGEEVRLEIPAESNVRDQAHNTVSVVRGLQAAHDPEEMKKLLANKTIQPVIDRDNGVNLTEQSDYTTFYVTPRTKNLTVGKKVVAKIKVDFEYNPDAQNDYEKFTPVITPMYYNEDRKLTRFTDEQGNYKTMTMAELTERELKTALGGKMTVSGTSQKN